MSTTLLKPKLRVYLMGTTALHSTCSHLTPSVLPLGYRE